MEQPRFLSRLFRWTERSTSVKETSTKVIVAKTVFIINYLAAKAKSRSLRNCKIHSATKQ